MSNKRLIKSTGTISAATLASRILGFIRDILIANYFGTTIFAEAFVISFRIPNLLRDLVGEGAANAAFVPVLTEYSATRSKEEFWRLSRHLFYILTFTLFMISLAGIIFAPAIVRLIAPGFIRDPRELEITVQLTRIVFPFIFFIGLVAWGMGVLNSLDHFAVPALGPVLLNATMISFMVYYMYFIGMGQAGGIIRLGAAVLAGGAIQMLVMWRILRKKGFRFFSHAGEKAKKKAFFDPAVKRIWKLLVPRLFGSAVYQLSVIVDNIFSTFKWIVGTGAPAALWYSYRLFHLPLAIFGISLATVALPKMSREVARKEMLSFKETINFSLRSVFLVLIPASVGLITLGKPIVRVLFERGEFTSYSTSITSSALFFYAFGLFACGGIKILVNSFFSLGDTLTPVKVASFSFFINLALNAVLMWPLKVGGLALATSVAATFNFLMLYRSLVRKIGDIGISKIAASLWRIVTASLIMGIFSFAAGQFLNGMKGDALIKGAGILAVITASAVIYVLSAFALGVNEIKGVLKWVLKRRS